MIPAQVTLRVFADTPVGTVRVVMQRIRIQRMPATPRERPKVLPLDPRDPDIQRAKAIQERYRPSRCRAA